MGESAAKNRWLPRFVVGMRRVAYSSRRNSPEDVRSKFMSRLKSLIFICLAAVAASPLNAFAESSGFDQPPARVVRYGDLDLNQQSGIVTLYSRIRSAAREVCEPMEGVSIKLLRAKNDCRHSAVARAVAEVNSAALTGYFDKTKTVTSQTH